MTAEVIALTEELHATALLLKKVVDRLDAADRRAKRHRFGTFLLALCLAAVVALGVWFYFDEREEDQQSCIDRRNGRLILRELVELSDDGDGGFNLTGLDSFDQLDPATQRYLTELEQASRDAPRPSVFVKNALDLLEIPNC